MTDGPTGLTKAVQTRAGRKARILCTDRKSPDTPIIALVEEYDGCERVTSYTAAGHYLANGSKHPFDLINVPERKVVYRLLYTEGDLAVPGRQYEKLSEAQACLHRGLHPWNAICAFTIEGGKVVAVELVKSDD